MPTMESYAAMNTDILFALSDEARKQKYNRFLSEPFKKKIDPDGVHVVAFSFIHNDSEVRLTLLVKVLDNDVPAHATLDVSLENFHAIPRFHYDDEGNLVMEPGDPVKRRRGEKPTIVVKKEDRASLFNRMSS